MKYGTLIPVVMAIGATGVMMRPVAAQDAGGPPPMDAGGGPGGPGGPGGFGGGPGGQMPNFEEMRQRMEQRIMEQLGATEEEWAAIKPTIEKIRSLRMAGMGGRGMMGFGGPGGQGGPGGPNGPGGANQAASPVAQAVRDLQDTLAKKDVTDAQVKAKLTALHDAKAKAQQDLKAAQDEMREILTVRQEAILTTMGVLD